MSYEFATVAGEYIYVVYKFTWTHTNIDALYRYLRKKVMKGKNSIFLSLLCIAALLMACESDETQESELSSGSVRDQETGIAAVLTTQTILNVADDLMDGDIQNGRSADESSCVADVAVDFNQENDSITLSIDYGDGSTCDSEVRAGKVWLTYSFKEQSEGTKELVFEKYLLDSVYLSGTFTITYTLDRDEGEVRSIVKSTNASLSYDDETSLLWTQELSCVLRSDGKETVDGSAEGTTREGDPFKATIENSIVFDVECLYGQYPVEGNITLVTTSSQDDVYEINYGDGTCDKTYSVSHNGSVSTYEFD